MSGGPAFDRDGKVIGVLSTMMKELGVPDASLISLHWAALAVEITPTFLPHLFSERIRLIDLDPTLCDIEGRDAIRSVVEPNTGIVRTAWTGT